MFRLEMSHRQSQRHEQRLTQAQKLEQKHKIICTLLLRHEELINALRGDYFHPSAVCHSCHHSLTSIEILKGFTNDVSDYFTKCPKCNTRLRAMLKSKGVAGVSAEIWLFCRVQTLDQIIHKELLDPEQWKSQHPAVYHSIIYHFGSLKKAYEEIGIDYGHVEQIDWRDKVVPFLGKLADTIIAACADIGVAKIANLRRSLDIKAFNQSELLEEG